MTVVFSTFGNWVSIWVTELNQTFALLFKDVFLLGIMDSVQSDEIMFSVHNFISLGITPLTQVSHQNSLFGQR
jgi:hypothetical protein